MNFDYSFNFTCGERSGGGWRSWGSAKRMEWILLYESLYISQIGSPTLPEWAGPLGIAARLPPHGMTLKPPGIRHICDGIFWIFFWIIQTLKNFSVKDKGVKKERVAKNLLKNPPSLPHPRVEKFGVQDKGINMSKFQFFFENPLSLPLFPELEKFLPEL